MATSYTNPPHAEHTPSAGHIPQACVFPGKENFVESITGLGNWNPTITRSIPSNFLSQFFF